MAAFRRGPILVASLVARGRLCLLLAAALALVTICRCSHKECNISLAVQASVVSRFLQSSPAGSLIRRTAAGEEEEEEGVELQPGRQARGAAGEPFGPELKIAAASPAAAAAAAAAAPPPPAVGVAVQLAPRAGAAAEIAPAAVAAKAPAAVEAPPLVPRRKPPPPVPQTQTLLASTSTPAPVDNETLANQTRAAFLSLKPSFLHIPKTAGTSITAAINAQSLDVDIPILGACNKHTPPRSRIPGSFTVVRQVLDRLVSEFCWMRMRDFFNVYRKEYGCPNVWPYTCDMFNAWLAAALDKYTKDPQFPDCHMIPQWCYAAQADYVVPMGDKLQEHLRGLHPKMHNITLERLNADTSEKAQGPCKRFNITTACISPENLAKVKEHFSEDFENLEWRFDAWREGTAGPLLNVGAVAHKCPKIKMRNR